MSMVVNTIHLYYCYDTIDCKIRPFLFSSSTSFPHSVITMSSFVTIISVLDGQIVFIV